MKGLDDDLPRSDPTTSDKMALQVGDEVELFVKAVNVLPVKIE